MCDYKIQKGERKGQVCGVKSREGKKCAKHRDKKENVYGRMPMEIVRMIMKYVEVKDDAAKVIKLEKQLGMELKRGKVEGKEYGGGNEKCDGRKGISILGGKKIEFCEDFGGEQRAAKEKKNEKKDELQEKEGTDVWRERVKRMGNVGFTKSGGFRKSIVKLKVKVKLKLKVKVKLKVKLEVKLKEVGKWKWK
ncbi:hypothetical protein DFJ73DRAFT_770084 [Zopfochytrium polystomum]|nr:hypothetical protein DFJ73DRAFT_770084 [Zopfochytrium polystomum]